MFVLPHLIPNWGSILLEEQGEFRYCPATV